MEKNIILKVNKIDYELFDSDIFNSDLIKNSEKYLSAFCQQYDSVLSIIFRQTRSYKYIVQKTTNSMDDSENSWWLNPSTRRVLRVGLRHLKLVWKLSLSLSKYFISI